VSTFGSGNARALTLSIKYLHHVLSGEAAGHACVWVTMMIRWSFEDQLLFHEKKDVIPKVRSARLIAEGLSGGHTSTRQSTGMLDVEVYV
jgi:hypothetical protein